MLSTNPTTGQTNPDSNFHWRWTSQSVPLEKVSVLVLAPQIPMIQVQVICRYTHAWPYSPSPDNNKPFWIWMTTTMTTHPSFLDLPLAPARTLLALGSLQLLWLFLNPWVSPQHSHTTNSKATWSSWWSTWTWLVVFSHGRWRSCQNISFFFIYSIPTDLFYSFPSHQPNYKPVVTHHSTQ